MKRIMFFATVVAMSLTVAMPMQAQSRKDKKAAAKAQWEMEQQQKREEDQLRHQMKMDSLRNAQKAAEEKAAREKKMRNDAYERVESQRRAKEAEEAARKKRAEEEAALEEKDVIMPCNEYESTATLIRARGVGEDLEQQMSVENARSAAIEELGSQISTKVQALLMNYKKSVNKNKKRDFQRRIEGLTMTEVDQATGYRIACRKTTVHMENGERIFTTYMVVELGEDQLLKPIYDGIQKDDEMKVDADYNSFKNEFDDHFKNKSQEALEKALNEEINE